MFDRLEIRVLPPEPRFPVAETRFRVNGVDVLEGAVHPGGRGPFAVDVLPADRPSPLRAGTVPRRLELGEPECTGGCCGFLSVVLERCGTVVRWSDWHVPWGGPRSLAPAPPEFHFDAGQYHAEVGRAEADGWWRARP